MTGAAITAGAEDKEVDKERPENNCYALWV